MSSVLITGAGHGIGAATAHALASRFDTVFVGDIDVAAVEAVADAIRGAGGSAEAIPLDVGDPGSWAAARSQIERAGDPLGAVVNNAFTLTVSPAHLLREVDWDRQIAVDLGSVYHSVRAFHDMLRAARGSIVNVASVHAIAGFHGHPAYAAAKGGMIALTRQLAVEYAPEIRVNALLPGSILTRAWDSTAEAERQAHLEHIPMGRFGRPEEIAASIVFLATGDSSYITATTLVVDGGLTASV